MIIWGITAMTHDASLSIIENGRLIFAAQSERYSKIKFDSNLHPDLIKEALSFGQPDEIVFYENVWKKKLRQLSNFDIKYAFDFNKIPLKYIRSLGIKGHVSYVDHHMSHAAAGYFTSEFEEATVVVIDAVGEFQTATAWYVNKGKFDIKLEVNFPSSIGLLYSAFTKRCGLRPTDEEYILMGMTAYGKPLYVDDILNDFIGTKPYLLKRNVHYGVGNWRPEADIVDLAASIQAVCEYQVLSFIEESIKLTGCSNLVYMGGVALNCVCNSKIALKNIWIMPNPGDAGSSLGAAAKLYGKKLKFTPYLGTNISGGYPIEPIVHSLLTGQIVGVANGRAEFGPRALGNRSLLADPRSKDAKDKMNIIKKRQKFRPFAPMVMEEHASDWFEMPLQKSPYMQFVAKCKRPEEVPAICHVDGTSRVQTVSSLDHPDAYNLLKEFYSKTGCPIILNTSLNIRGKPIVNDVNDAIEFSKLYNIKVF